MGGLDRWRNNFAKGSSLRLPQVVDHKQHTRKIVCIARWEMLKSYPVYYYQPCIHNEVASLYHRMLCKVILPTEQGLRKLKRLQTRILHKFRRVDRWSQARFIASYGVDNPKVRRYTIGAERYNIHGLTRADATLTQFCKAEPYPLPEMPPDKPELGKEEGPSLLKHPRSIHFRTFQFSVALGTYIKPMEHNIYQLKGSGRYLPKTRVIGKGLSTTARAQLLVKKWSRFKSPVCVTIDCTRFDRHVSAQLLALEHRFYLHMNSSPELQRLLSWQIKNRGTSTNGVKYAMNGKRVSGDMNTALGNCLLMVLMVATAMEGHDYDMLDDGDDCLIMIEESELSWVLENVPTMFREFGMLVKIENIARRLEDVEWCQAHPVETKAGWKFVRDPSKIFSTALCGVKYTDSLKSRARLVKSVGMCELMLNQGVPLLQEYAKMLIRSSGAAKPLSFQSTDSLYYRVERELSYRSYKKLGEVPTLPITPLARRSFHAAFGIEPLEQIYIENKFRATTLNLVGIGSTSRDIFHHAMSHDRASDSCLYPPRDYVC